jgi:hypothetical protein
MALENLISDNDGVLSTASVLTCLSKSELRWRIASGRWQRPCHGVIVTHSGPLTDEQILCVALRRCGPNAALAGLTAAKLDDFKGFDDKKPLAEIPIYVVTPPGHKRHPAPLDLNVIVHQSRLLGDGDVHPLRKPRRTRVPRSLVDAAEWMKTDRGAMAVLAAGVQQRLVRVSDLRAVLGRPGKMRRRGLMSEILGDIEGGAQALSELDFNRNVIRQFDLPKPSHQVGRRDSRNRQRWIDVAFDRWKVIVEIDGAQHIEPLNQWDDMERDNDFNIEGYRVLRFPAWRVRRNPEYVAKKILEALRRGGYQG